MERRDLLTGFDMVAAITQDAVNSELERLAFQGTLPSRLLLERKRTRLDAEVGAPTVGFNAFSNNRFDVLFHLHLPSGTFTYYDPDEDDRLTVPIKDWRLSYRVNMNLTKLEKSLIERSQSIPERVKAQLAKFQDSMFTINYLFLNFQDADLIGEGFLVKQSHLPGLKESGIPTLALLMNAHLTAKQGTENPYILGYAVNIPDVKPSETPTYRPSGTTFSTTPHPQQEGLSTINYCLMTEQRKFPDDPGAGQFTTPWVTSHSGDGTFAVARRLFFEGYLLPRLQSALGVIKPFSPFKFDSSLIPDTPPLAPIRKLLGADAAVRWAVHEESPVPLVIPRDLEAFFSVSAKDRKTCLVVVPRNSNRIEITGVLHREFTTKAVGMFSATHAASIHYKMTLTALTASDGRIIFEKTEEVLDPQTHFDADFLSKLLKSISELFTGEVNKGMREAFNILQEGLIRNWQQVAQIGGDVKNCFILPGGKVFYFKQPRFGDEGDLLTTITYVDYEE